MYLGGVFNKTIIPLALVGCEMVIANSALRRFLQTTQSVSLMDTQAIGKANNNTVLFLLKSTATEQVVLVNIACPRESRVIISHSYLFTVSRPRLISNVESNGTDMINIRCEIERELSKVA